MQVCVWVVGKVANIWRRSKNRKKIVFTKYVPCSAGSPSIGYLLALLTWHLLLLSKQLSQSANFESTIKITKLTRQIAPYGGFLRSCRHRPSVLWAQPKVMQDSSYFCTIIIQRLLKKLCDTRLLILQYFFWDLMT